jgi:hypothetical protein
MRLQAEDFARLVRTGQGHCARPADAIAALTAAQCCKPLRSAE